MKLHSLVCLTSGFWLLASGLVLDGQQPPPPFRAAVDIVQLDVSVLDSERRPITGLAAADFTVLDKGVPQPIVAFEAIDVPDASALPASWVRDAPIDVETNDTKTRRVVIIVLDDAYIPVDAGPAAKKIARTVVEHLGPADIAAVTFTEQGPRQDITTDRTRLLKAIDGFVPHPGSATPAAAKGLRAEVGRGSGRFGGTPGGCGIRGRIRAAYACVIDTLVTAAEALRRAPLGRKTLVYISGGAPIDFTMTDLRGGDAPLGEQVGAVQAMLRAMQEANVNVYAIDPSGLTAEGIIGPRLDSLRGIAEDTGGRATLATNTPAEAVPQIFRENSSYYLLGVRPASGAQDGEFRRLQITVNRPGAEVRARPGYVAGARNALPTETSAAAAALSGALPGGSLPLAVTTAPFAIPGKKPAAVAVVIAFPDPPVTRQTFDVVTMALDADCGDCRKLPSQRQTVTISAPSRTEDQSALRPGQSTVRTAELLSRLDLPPGKYEIRVAATSGESTGSVVAHVDVPDYAKAALTAGLVLSTRGAAGPNTLLGDVLPVIPTARREFRPDAAVSALFRVYQGGSKTPERTRITATIRDADDRIVFDQTTTTDGSSFTRNRSLDFSLALPLSRLKGNHLLTIKAQVGAHTVERSARFTVR